MGVSVEDAQLLQGMQEVIEEDIVHLEEAIGEDVGDGTYFESAELIANDLRALRQLMIRMEIWDSDVTIEEGAN